MIDETYNKLVSQSKSSRVRNSLKAIQDTCKEMVEAGVKDLTIAAVARAGSKRGVPLSQSIRNKGGEPYRELIYAWKRECGSVDNRLPRKDWIREIEDPRLRFLVTELAVQNRNNLCELQKFRSITKFEIDFREPAKENANKKSGLFLVDSELDALRSAIDEKKLEKVDLLVTPRGSIVSVEGVVFFERGFVTALQKVIAFCT